MRAAVWLVAGCSGPVELRTTVLAPVSGWQEVDVAADPFADHRPSSVDCPEGAWGDEDGALEVQTGVCNYFAVVAPTLVDLEPGDMLQGTVWYQDLDAPEPAEAHVAVWIGTDVQWEAWVPIPDLAAVHSVEVPIAESWPAGTPIGLHLHNHGFNSWKFAEFRRTR